MSKKWELFTDMLIYLFETKIISKREFEQSKYPADFKSIESMYQTMTKFVL